jgi:hypothetical protein
LLISIYRKHTREPRLTTSQRDRESFVRAWRGDLELPLSSIALEDVADLEALDHIFYRFNLDHPEDFLGPSLSVGDIVTLEDSRSYVCLSVGWRRIYDFNVDEV